MQWHLDSLRQFGLSEYLSSLLVEHHYTIKAQPFSMLSVHDKMCSPLIIYVLPHRQMIIQQCAIHLPFISGVHFGKSTWSRYISNNASLRCSKASQKKTCMRARIPNVCFASRCQYNRRCFVDRPWVSRQINCSLNRHVSWVKGSTSSPNSVNKHCN